MTRVAQKPGLRSADITSGGITATTDDVDFGDIAKALKHYITVALSGDGADIAAGLSKGSCRVPVAGSITAMTIDCDPADEPSAISVQVDCNVVDRTTGVRTSVLSAVASIATSANTGSGTLKVDGTEDVSAGDLLTFDVDQGSDGSLLTATIEITPS